MVFGITGMFLVSIGIDIGPFISKFQGCDKLSVPTNPEIEYSHNLHLRWGYLLKGSEKPKKCTGFNSQQGQFYLLVEIWKQCTIVTSFYFHYLML